MSSLGQLLSKVRQLETDALVKVRQLLSRSPVGAYRSTPEVLVTSTLRVRGHVETDALVESTGLGEDQIGALMLGLGDAGHVSYRQGLVVGWGLTPQGRTYGEALLVEELQVSGARPTIETAYRDFLKANQDFLSLCTDWQLRPNPDGDLIVNDHSNSDHDALVVARLGDAEVVFQAVTASLAGVLSRFEAYGVRFADAVVRVQAGEVEWFTRPMIDSCHTVWFELHENLLATLGIERSHEQAD
ncbi:MAG: hypothetical protein P8M16_09785 [Acidimicrobiales bacterium]|nr:hypothetical protein [Acidimicrobiales bacterium]